MIYTVRNFIIKFDVWIINWIKI